MIVQTAWVLSLILAVEPASAPHRPAFDPVAESVAKESSSRPLFAGESGPAKTAAVLVALFHFESANNPKAVGDCAPKDTTKAGTCVPGTRGHSFGLGQTNETNFRGLKIAGAEAYLEDVPLQVATVLTMLHQSFAICRSRPLEERAAWYASGGDGCPSNEDALRKSRHRIRLGQSLFAKHPPSDG